MTGKPAPMADDVRVQIRCWQCGGALTNPFKRPVEGVERTLPLGEKVRLHKICAVTFDADQADRILTAKPIDETFSIKTKE